MKRHPSVRQLRFGHTAPLGQVGPGTESSEVRRLNVHGLVDQANYVLTAFGIKATFFTLFDNFWRFREVSAAVRRIGVKSDSEAPKGGEEIGFCAAGDCAVISLVDCRENVTFGGGISMDFFDVGGEVV